MCKGLAVLPATYLKSVDLAEVHKWRQSFGMMINSAVGLKTFSNFLKSEFSQENIEFWVECEEYRRMTSKKKLAVKAKLIYSVYVDVESPKQVNLDSTTREKTEKNMADGSLSCFEEAQRKIFLLMEKDSYRRFLKSKVFLDLVRDLQAVCSMEKTGKQNVSILLTM